VDDDDDSDDVVVSLRVSLLEQVANIDTGVQRSPEEATTFMMRWLHDDMYYVSNAAPLPHAGELPMHDRYDHKTSYICYAWIRLDAVCNGRWLEWATGATCSLTPVFVIRRVASVE
jgi:hypothetical protein